MPSRFLVRLAPGLLAALLAGALPTEVACAHGGRFSGPGGRGMPPDSTMPGPPAPRRGPPPTTPGAGIPTTTGSLPDVYWGTWWALNRWAFMPERGAIARRRRVLTGGSVGHSREQLSRERRALLARQVIEPFLKEQLDPDRHEKDTVSAAALLALAKVAARGSTLELILGRAEKKAATRLERESAALAVGLLRRSDPARRIDPVSLDLARMRLLDLIADDAVPIRTRCFGAFSLGLLADQGYGSPFSKQGRLVVKGLLARLREPEEGPDLHIALLTALGMQPRASIPGRIYEDLARITNGVQIYKRKWSPIERSHALSTLAHLESPGWVSLLLRALGDRRLPKPVLRAARLSLGAKAARLSPEQRLAVSQALLRCERNAPDALSKGLGQIALARVLHADLRAGSSQLLEKTAVGRVLLEGALKSPITVRGFHVLALALAARGVRSSHPVIEQFIGAASERMLAGFDRPRGDNDLRGAYVIGLGLLEVQAARDRLVGVLTERNAGPALRARVAIALAQIGAGDRAVLDALRAVSTDTRPLAPRSAAALSLSLITGTPLSDMLVAQLREASSQREQVQAAAALGQLDDPAALPAVIALARAHAHNFEMRAVAIAILGMLGDPEEHPSLFQLSLDANYIARTDALNEAFTLL